MKNLTVIAVAFYLSFISVSTWAEGLVGPSESDADKRSGYQASCLRQAKGESGDIGLSDELAKLMLKDKSTEGFLWRGSLSGPKLIAERKDGVLIPSASVFNAARSREVTDRFVLCLLTYGYRWEQSNKDGIAEIAELAEHGNVFAQSTFGLMYYYGHGVKLDQNLAVVWIRKAADQGYANAQYNLGIAYGKGEGVAINETEAIRWIKKAAEQGHAKAKELLVQYDLKNAKSTTSSSDNSELDNLRKTAAQGDAKAQYQLATRYEDGKGVNPDMEAAIGWYRKAAEQGFPDAQRYLGVIYDKGRGVKQDDAEAFKWYRSAAEKGNPQAQFNLGVFYVNGRGTKPDEEEGWKWIRKAAQGGHAGAQAALKSSRK